MTYQAGKTIYSRYLVINKISAEQRIVEGFASTEEIDDQAEIVDTIALKAALPDYMEFGALREMHQPSAVGTVLKAEIIPGKVKVGDKTYFNPLRIVAKIIDGAAWEKIKAGVYKGFSIGGQVLASVLEKLNGKTIRRITRLALYEISLVDRPANPDAKILLWKGVRMAGDPTKAIEMLQGLRNEVEVSGDLEAAALYTNAIALILQANGDADATVVAEPAEEADEEHAELGEEPPETETAAGGEVEGEKPPDKGKLKAAATSTTLQKAGRIISGKNSQAIHQIIKGLAEMLAGSGDTVAQDVVKCYGAQGAQKASQPEDLAKALTPVLDDLKKTLTGISGRLETLERRPTNNGPALRAAEKTIVGQTALDTERSKLEESTANLRKMAAIEPDPLKRQEYVRQLMIAEQRLSQR